jgi:trypsin
LEEISSNERNFDVLEIHRHENYSRSSYFNDIAVLTLRQRVQFSKQIFPICLPEEDIELNDRIAFITGGLVNTNLFKQEKLNEILKGWGSFAYGEKTSPILHQAAVPMWTDVDCRRAYPRRVTSLQVCAGYPSGKQDSCQVQF